MRTLTKVGGHPELEESKAPSQRCRMVDRMVARERPRRAAGREPRLQR
jgi:hypothetical protein